MTTSVARQRIVAITGMGAVTPLGLCFADSWQALLEQTSGATTLEEALWHHQGLPKIMCEKEWKMARELPCQVVAPVKGFVASNNATAEFGRRSTARFIEFALRATEEALQQAGLNDHLTHATDEQRARIGVSIGSGMSAVREIGQAYQLLQPTDTPEEKDGGVAVAAAPTRRPYRRLSPHFVPKVLPNSAAGRVSMLHGGLWGPNLAPSTACAAGAHALGHAWNAIQTGQADIMVAGGTEAAVEPLSIAGFCQLRALATQYNDTPAIASRPFDVHRNGFVLAEGAAILVLEDWQNAVDRGYQGLPLAVLSGYGASGDGFHVTAPDPAGQGAIRAMKGALTSSSFISQTTPIEPADIQYVNAHATSTPKGDEIEAYAIAEYLGKAAGRERPLWTSSTKGATGHLLGAAGALEAAYTVQSLKDQVLPGTLNLESVEDPSIDVIGYVRQVHRLADEGYRLDNAISNSFGFGGVNASLLFQSGEAVLKERL